MGLYLKSFWVELLILLVTIGLYLYYKLRKNRRYFADKGMPYSKPKSILGASHDIILLKKTLGSNFDDIYKEFSENRYVGVFQMLQPTYLIRDPKLIEKVLIKDFSHFHDHGLDIDAETNPLDGHLFNLKGEVWRTMRHKLSPTFTSGKLKWMFGIMEKTVDLVMEQFDELVGKGPTEVLVKDMFVRYSIDVIASCAFGIDGEAIKDPDCEFRKMSKKIFHPNKFNAIKGMGRFFMPKPFIKLKIKSIPDDLTNFFISITKQGLKHRKESGEVRTDFLQLLLELKEKGKVEVDSKDLEEKEKTSQEMEGDLPSESIELTDEILAAQVFVFFIAGFENAASVMTIACYFLLKNQEIQERVRDEIMEVKKKYGCINYEAVRDMKLLSACVDETLRLFPPGELMFRECTKDFDLGDGKKIVEGERLLIPVYSLHRDPKYWDQPEEFMPDRFLDKSRTIIPGTYLPFGDGPRICIAQRFALLEIKLAMAKLIERFRLTKSERLQEPLRLKPGLTQDVEGGMWSLLTSV